MSQRVSFSSLALVKNPFGWAYDLEDLGFTGWEIVSEGKQKIDENTISQIKDIYETTDLELTLHIPFSDLNLASLNQPIWNETIRQMEQSLENASQFIDFAVVHPGHLSPIGMQMPDVAWKQNHEGLQLLCDFADNLGIRLGVENMVNMPHILGKQAEELLGMVESLERENAGITFDVGHAFTNGLIDDFLKMDKSRLFHVHLHDNHGKKDEHLPLGYGDIDWKKVFAGLSGYKGRFVTEARTVEEGLRSLKYIQKNISR